MSIINQAYEIAKKELRSCYDQEGIVAGRRQYEDFWTRDAAFACLAALELDDVEMVGKHLKMLISFQKSNGAIPFLIRKNLALFSTLRLKIPIKLKAKFRSHKMFFLSEMIDSNPYFVILCCAFLKKKKDYTIPKEFSSSIELALEKSLKKVDQEDFLTKEGLLTGWDDATYKKGKTLITNILFYKAFRSWEEICEERSFEIKSDFIGVADKIRKAIQDKFWGKNYFIDWIDGDKEYRYFDSIANFLAILWNIADKEQKEKIIDFTFKKAMNPPFVKRVYPRYPWYRVEIINRILGMGGYVNQMLWLEPICLFVMCLRKANKEQKAKKLIEAIAEIIVRDQGLYEVYELNKKPANRWHYKAEHPYARGAGLFILAHSKKLGL